MPKKADTKKTTANKTVSKKTSLKKSSAKKIVSNAKSLAQSLIEKDYNLVTGGTDTHVMLIDLTNKDISGKQAEKSLEQAGINLNKNMVPFDKRSPFVTSGIRIGTPAITTRGMGNQEMSMIADLIDRVINNPDDIKVISKVKKEVNDLCDAFPIYDEFHN